MNEPERDNSELERLIESVATGTHSAADEARLEEIVASDLAARRAYLERMFLIGQLHCRFRKHVQLDAGVSDPRSEVSRPKTRSAIENPHSPPPIPQPRAGSPVLGFLGHTSTALSKPVLWSILGAGIAFFGYVALITWGIRDHSSSPLSPGGRGVGDEGGVATITYTSDAEWPDSPSSPLAPGGREAGGEGAVIASGDPLQIQSGLVELKLKQGTTLVIEGPARWSIDSTNHATLELGKLVAKVPRKAVGFILDTPTAQIIDLGTEFGVETNDTGRTEVHVFRGAVDWQARESGTGKPPNAVSRRLVAGEAVSVSIASSDPVKHSADPTKFARIQSLPKLSKADSAVPSAAAKDAELSVQDGLLLWLDVDDVNGDGNSTGEPAAGSLIGRWANKAARLNPSKGLPWDATQSQADLQPAFLPEKRSGFAWLHFTGDQHFGKTLTVKWSEAVVPPYSIFLVGQVLGNSLDNATDYLFDGLHESARVALGVNVTGKSQDDLFFSSGSKWTVTRWTRREWQARHLYGMKCLPDAMELWIDGSRRAAEPGETVALQDLRLGSRYSGGEFLNGVIGEVLIYDRALAEADFWRVTHYMSERWFIQQGVDGRQVPGD